MGALFGVCFKVTATKCFPGIKKKCCGGKKKPVKIKVHELKFMSTISEGYAHGKPEIIDEVFRLAEQDVGGVDEIFGAKDDSGDLPIHKAAYYGNPTSLRWILEKWEEHKKELDIDVLDQHGYTPLFLACFRGYSATVGIDTTSPIVMERRRECVEILL